MISFASGSKIAASCCNRQPPCASHEKRASWFRCALLFLAALPIALALSGCTGPVHKFNQKITVTLETPNGEVSGYTVQHVEIKEILWGSLSGAGVSTGIKGEAVVVEVAPGRYLFVLCHGAGSLLSNVFRDVRAETFDKRMDILTRSRERRVVPERLILNELATFTNPADPSTGIRLKPDELGRHFGEDVRLKSITIEVTNEPVTQGRVVAALPWYGSRYNISREKWEVVGNEVGYIISWLTVDGKS